MRRLLLVLVFALTAQLAATAHAAVTSIYANYVAKPAGILPGFTTNDIMIDFAGNLRGQQLILELTQGSIYQDPANPGTVGPPSSFIVGLVPSVAYDTFVTMGSLVSDSGAPILPVGGAVDLQPGSTQKFDTEGLNIAWAPGTGVDIPSGNDFLTARITLSNDARGTLRYFGSTGAGTGDPLTRTMSVGAGQFCMTDCGGFPPDVADKLVEYTSQLPSTLVSETLPLTDDDPTGGTWSLVSFMGRDGKLPGPGVPTVNPQTGLFEWVGNGSQEGIYDAVIQFLDSSDFADTGTLSIVWHVPEPASVWLLCVAASAMCVTRRRRAAKRGTVSTG